jgi:RNA polymerase sigma-70 factor, ECF subfamily
MEPDSSETQQLLDQARGGDSQAIARLMEMHRDSMRRMISLRLDPAIAARVDASDVVQEVLLEVSRRLDAYLRAPTMPFHLWLRHVAKDRIIDAYRRHRHAERRGVDRERPLTPAGSSSADLAAQLCDAELTPASAAMQQELERRLHDAIARLDDDDREIILLRHFEQLSNQEVAQLHGLSEPAASMQHLRALRKLRQLLQPGGGKG